MAAGKKEFSNLEVLHFTLLYLRPEGRRVNSRCWGGVFGWRQPSSTFCRCLWSVVVVLPYHTLMQLVKILSMTPQKTLLRIFGDASNVLSPLREHSCCRALLTSCVAFGAQVRSLTDVNATVFAASRPFTFQLPRVQWPMRSPLLPSSSPVSRVRSSHCDTRPAKPLRPRQRCVLLLRRRPQTL